MRSENANMIADYKIIISTQSILDLFNQSSTNIGQSGRSIAGLVFFPLFYPSANPDTVPFHSLGIQIVIATWISGRPDTLSLDTSRTRAVVSDNSALFYPNIPNPYPHQAPITLNNPMTNSNQWEIVDRDSTDQPVREKRLQFDQTIEYDLVFLDIEQCKYLAGIIESRSTSVRPYRRFVFNQKNYFYQDDNTEQSRGIQVSRAFFSIDVDETNDSGSTILPPSRSPDLSKWRTLKFNPWPIPTIRDYASRSSVAYHLGPVCPPGWTPYATNISQSLALFRLHEEAKQNGLVGKIPPDPYESKF